MLRLTTVFLAGALATPAFLLAQGPPAGPRAGMGMGMGPRMDAQGPAARGGMFAPRMLLNHRDRLNLTDDQATQLETLATEVRTAHEQAQEAARPHEEKLRELWQADKPDVQAIQAEMQALMAARHTAGLATAAATARAKGLLTADQRGRMEGWMDGRRAAARRFDRGPGVDGPRRGGMRMQPRMRRFE